MFALFMVKYSFRSEYEQNPNRAELGSFSYVSPGRTRRIPYGQYSLLFPASIRRYGAHVSREGGEQDPSKVFITVADADSIHHKEYFANLTLKALPLSAEERTWTMWQPPILNWRNWETV